VRVNCLEQEHNTMSSNTARTPGPPAPALTFGTVTAPPTGIANGTVNFGELNCGELNATKQ